MLFSDVRGACWGQSDLFFPVENRTAETRAQIKAAKAICEGCVLKDPCLEYALENEDFGIWGGLTEDERRRYRRDRNVVLSGRFSKNSNARWSRYKQ